jgi:Ca2+/Na+ antiporter
LEFVHADSVWLLASAALMSEFLVDAVGYTARTFGMTEVFVGVILVALTGNAAAHSTAILVAAKNQMDLALSIAIGSSMQIALLVAPLLVFVGYLFGQPMNLLFTTFEVVSVALTVGIVSLVAVDGESHWMEGVQLPRHGVSFPAVSPPQVCQSSVTHTFFTCVYDCRASIPFSRPNPLFLYPPKGVATPPPK